MPYCQCDNCGYTIDVPYVGQECPNCHKGIMREMTEMPTEEEEWEIEILAIVKGTEQAKAAICEVHATLLNYPLSYIDTKLTSIAKSQKILSEEEIRQNLREIEEAEASGTKLDDHMKGYVAALRWVLRELERQNPE